MDSFFVDIFPVLVVLVGTLMGIFSVIYFVVFGREGDALPLEIFEGIVVVNSFALLWISLLYLWGRLFHPYGGGVEPWVLSLAFSFVGLFHVIVPSLVLALAVFLARKEGRR